MRWEKWGDYAMKCAEHGLSISKARVQGAWTYTLWRVRKREWDSDGIISHHKSFEAAKNAALNVANTAT